MVQGELQRPIALIKCAYSAFAQIQSWQFSEQLQPGQTADIPQNC
jgi:hypothetical protein